MGRTTVRMNQLKVNQRETISALRTRGWSARRIARELGCDRDTVSKYIRLEEAAKPATLSPGSATEYQPEELHEPPDGEAKPPTPSPGKTDDAGVVGAAGFAQALAAAQAN